MREIFQKVVSKTIDSIICTCQSYLWVRVHQYHGSKPVDDLVLRRWRKEHKKYWIHLKVLNQCWIHLKVLCIIAVDSNESNGQKLVNEWNELWTNHMTWLTPSCPKVNHVQLRAWSGYQPALFELYQLVTLSMLNVFHDFEWVEILMTFISKYFFRSQPWSIQNISSDHSLQVSRVHVSFRNCLLLKSSAFLSKNYLLKWMLGMNAQKCNLRTKNVWYKEDSNF